MFDIAWSEMMVIGAVALLVIGPKDLPKALRSVGEAVGKVRRMAGEFQNQFNDAMREAELHDIKKQVEDVGGSVQSATKVDFNPIQTIRDEFKGVGTGAAAAGATSAAATPDAGAATPDPLPVPLAEPVVPLPDIPPPPSSADLMAQIVPQPAAAEAATTPDAEEAPKLARKPKANDGDAV